MATKWRVATSLMTLLRQVNEMSPNRSKVSDGTIGDLAHQQGKSEHNPDKNGVVHARDITNDPAHGMKGKVLANALLASRDPRILYVISDREIASGAAGPSPWKWRPYKGKNPHEHHMHISVVLDKRADDAYDWDLSAMKVSPEEAKKPVERPANPTLVRGNTGPDVERAQKLLIAKGAKIDDDSVFGGETEAAVKAFQKKQKIPDDGRIGQLTWDRLLA